MTSMPGTRSRKLGVRSRGEARARAGWLGAGLAGPAGGAI